MVSVTLGGKVVTRDTGRQVCVYFVLAAEAGLMKIGSTYDLPNRLKQMQTGSAEVLKVLATWHSTDARKRERELHKRFAKHRAHGEWFHTHPDILDFIEQSAGRQT